MPPVVYGRVVGDDRLAQQRLDDRRGQRVGDLLQLVAGPQRPLAGEDDGLLAAVEQRRGALERLLPAGRRSAGVQAFDVCPLTFIGDGVLVEVDRSCQSLRQLMCATPRAPTAPRGRRRRPGRGRASGP